MLTSLNETGWSVSLIDFGSAAELYDAPLFLNIGTKRGTLKYLAPEAWNGVYSPASDMWALGVCLSLLILLTYPFDGNKEEEIKRSMGNGLRPELFK